MIAVAFVAGLYAIILSHLFRQWQRGNSSTDFVVGAFPTALLFLTLPPVLQVTQLMQTFVNISKQGGGAKAIVLPAAEAITDVSRAGALGFLIAVLVAAGLQMFASGQSDGEPGESNVPLPLRRTLLLAGSMLLAVPAGLLASLTNGIPRIVLYVANATGPAAGETAESLSATMARNILVSIVGSVALSGVICVLVALKLAGDRSVVDVSPPRRYWWGVPALTCIWGLWTVLQLSADMNAFQLAASR